MSQLTAPFPWFGGKSRAASLIWDRLGQCANYVEPFAGSLAVLLNRPHPQGIETVNDIDGYLCNFWRALQADPNGLADAATWPVSECDLLARHKWLLSTGADRVALLKTDPAYYDIEVAGWWVWGIACWIGSGWCAKEVAQMPHLGDAGQGVTNLALRAWFAELSERLVRVRVCCGEWDRVLGPSVTFKNGLTGIVLDPPYDTGICDDVYRTGSVSKAVSAWAIENGDNPQLRIALCCYEGEHDMPSNWHCEPWKARGGMGSQGKGRGRENAGKERIWFSPYCLGASLFEEFEVSA